MKYIAGVATLGVANMISNAFTSVFSVPLTVPMMAAAGAMLSFAYDDDASTKTKRTKKQVVFLVVANTVITTAAVAVLPEMLGWNWYSTKLQGSVALLMAASARFVIPLAIKTLPEIVRKWFKVGEYRVSDKTEEQSDET